MYTNPTQQAYTNSTGTSPISAPIISQRNPNANDIYYPIGQFWIDQSTASLYYLNFKSNAQTVLNPSGALQATWELISVGSVLVTLSDTSDTTVSPSSSTSTPPDNIQLFAGTGISIVSNPSDNRLTITNTAPSAGSGIQTITGNDDTPESPNGSGNFNFLTSNSTVVFSGSLSTETLNFGVNNLLIGSSGSITTGGANVSLGNSALASTTVGGSNVAVGVGALNANLGGVGNTAVGNNAMKLFTSVSAMTNTYNTALGNNSLDNLLTGTNNIAIGELAASSYTGSESSNIIIGNTGTISESHIIRIGTQGTGAGQQSSTYIAGIEGVTVTSPVGLVNINALGQLGSTPTSGFVTSVTAGTNLNNSGTATAPIINLDSQILQPSGTLTAPSYSFSAASNSGWYYDTSYAGPALSAAGNEVIVANGNNVLIGSSGGTNHPSLQLTGQFIIKTIGTATNFVDNDNDTYIGVTSTSTPITITMPGIFGTTGIWMIVKDESGGAGTNNITINTSDGSLLDGHSTFIIDSNYGSAMFISRAGNWWVV